MYVKIITSSGFKSTILTDIVQGQLRVPFRFGRCLPEVHLFTGRCRLLRRLFDLRLRARLDTKWKKKWSRIYDLGVVPTRGKNAMFNVQTLVKTGNRPERRKVFYSNIWRFISSYPEFFCTYNWQMYSKCY